MGELWPKVGDSDAVLYLPLALRENQDGLQDLTRLSQTVAALGDPDEDFRLLDRLPGVELLVPAGDEVDDDLCTLTRADEPAELRELLEKAPFAGLPVGERLRRLPGNAFFAHPAALRPLSQLDWSDPALAAPARRWPSCCSPSPYSARGRCTGCRCPGGTPRGRCGMRGRRRTGSRSSSRRRATAGWTCSSTGCGMSWISMTSGMTR